MPTCSPRHAGPAAPAPPDDLREHFRALLPRLLGGHGGQAPLRTVGLTSCWPGEGVSTVAAHLAVAAAARAPRPVLLVDANLERPSAHRRFALRPAPGLADALLSGGPPAVQPSAVPQLSLLVAGDVGGRRAHAETSPHLTGLLQALQEDFGLVLFDLPPASGGPFAGRLAGLLDGTLLVVEAERARWQEAQREKELLAQAGANLLGAVLNKRRQYVPRWLQRFF
jgi:Mrp family chromosome partitioning ATPase